MTRLIAIAVVLLGGIAQGGEPVAFIDCKFAFPNDAPGGVPIKSYADLATKVAPQLKAAGITRLMLHSPFGIFCVGWVGDPSNDPKASFYGLDKVIYNAAWKRLDAREIRVDQAYLAQTIGAPYADWAVMKQAVKIFADHGVKEVIFYIGSPSQLPNAADSWQHVKPYLDCGPTVSVGFDMLGAPPYAADMAHVKNWTHGGQERKDVTELVQKVRATGAKVYAEPSLSAAMVTVVGKYLDGVIDATVPTVGQPGETLVIVDWGSPAPANVTPLWRVKKPSTIPITKQVTVDVPVQVNWGAVR